MICKQLEKCKQELKALKKEYSSPNKTEQLIDLKSKISNIVIDENACKNCVFRNSKFLDPSVFSLN